MAVKFRQKVFFWGAVTALTGVVQAGTGVAELNEAGKQRDIDDQRDIEARKNQVKTNAMTEKSNELQKQQNEIQKDNTAAITKLARETSNLNTTTPAFSSAMNQLPKTVAMPTSTRTAGVRSYSVIQFHEGKQKEFNMKPPTTAKPPVKVGGATGNSVQKPSIPGLVMDSYGTYSGVQGAEAAKAQTASATKELQKTKIDNQQQLNTQATQLANQADQVATMNANAQTFKNSVNQLPQTSFFSEPSVIKFKQKNYVFANGAVGRQIDKFAKTETGKAVRGLATVTGNVLRDNRGKLLASLAGGVGMGVIGYGVNKGLQAKMKADGIDMDAINRYQEMQKQRYGEGQYQQPDPQRPQPQRRQFSVRSAAGVVVNNAFGGDSGVPEDQFHNPIFKGTVSEKAKQAFKHYGKEAFGVVPIGFGVLTSVPTVGTYFGERKKLQQLSDLARAELGRPPMNGNLQRQQRQNPKFRRPDQGQGPTPYPPQQQRTFAFANGWVGRQVDKFGNWFRNWKKAPAYNTLSWADRNLGSQGGSEGIQRLGDRIIHQGNKQDSKFLRNAGQWVKDHPKTMLGGAFVVGGGVVMGAFEKGENIVKGAMNRIDPRAYDYEKYQESKVE